MPQDRSELNLEEALPVDEVPLVSMDPDCVPEWARFVALVATVGFGMPLAVVGEHGLGS